jgi:N-acetylglutamate synthase-like GNAT family acetyltransferase
MKIDIYQEYEIPTKWHEELTTLKNRCVPEHQKDRSYFKQLPHFRLICFADNKIIGQMGVDHRVIRVADEVFQIFGLIDLCVAEEQRRECIASSMLEKIFNLGRNKGIDFLFLLAADSSFYEKHDFRVIDDLCSWLRIHEHRNFGVAVERLEGEIMIRKIGEKVWPNGPIDLLGYMF